MRILVSACLLGINCRYNGERVMAPGIERLMARHTLIPVCPEQLGGLATPRQPSEILGERVLSHDGTDLTQNYELGAAETLRLAQMYGCEYAILKERSPSCGHGIVHNGQFDGGLISGSGVAASALERTGIRIFGESELEKLLCLIE